MSLTNLFTTLKLVADGPTDRRTDQPTDRRTLSRIELLSQLKREIFLTTVLQNWEMGRKTVKRSCFYRARTNFWQRTYLLSIAQVFGCSPLRTKKKVLEVATALTRSRHVRQNARYVDLVPF